MPKKEIEVPVGSGPFAEFEAEAYPYKYEVELVVRRMCGGVPRDQAKAIEHFRRKLADNDVMIRQAIADRMLEAAAEGKPISEGEAVESLNNQQNLVGFRRDERGLWYGGWQLKAAIKEAASVAAASKLIRHLGWAGNAKKGVLSFLSEHFFVVEDKIYLGVNEPSDVDQNMVHARGNHGISYHEVVEDAKLSATVMCDIDLTPKEWAMIWLVCQQQGIGAQRSQGYGRFKVARWDKLQ